MTVVSASAELRRLLDQATPGPWREVGSPLVQVWAHGVCILDDYFGYAQPGDAALIVFLVNHASVLADLIDAAEKYLGDLDVDGAAHTDELTAVLARLTTGETIGG